MMLSAQTAFYSFLENDNTNSNIKHSTYLMTSYYDVIK